MAHVVPGRACSFFFVCGLAVYQPKKRLHKSLRALG